MGFAGFSGVACAASLAMATSASALTLSNGGNAGTSGWGAANEAFGQTFSMPVAGSLDSISFFIDDNGGALSFNAYVYAWDGAKATGPALFSSGTLSTAGVTGVFSQVTAATGGVALSTGVDYVAFFQATSSGPNIWSFNPSGGYADGFLVIQNNDGDPGMLTSTAWGSFPAYDFTFAFEITPATVPIPAALPLLAGALGLLGLAARRPSRAA